MTKLTGKPPPMPLDLRCSERYSVAVRQYLFEKTHPPISTTTDTTKRIIKPIISINFYLPYQRNLLLVFNIWPKVSISPNVIHRCILFGIGQLQT